MAGIKDFFNESAGRIKNATNAMLGKSADAPERVLNTSAEQPKPAPAQSAAAQGARAAPVAPAQPTIFDTVEKAKVQSGVHNPMSTPLGQNVQAAQAAVPQGAQGPTMRANPNVDLRAGVASPEAQQFARESGLGSNKTFVQRAGASPAIPRQPAPAQAGARGAQPRPPGMLGRAGAMLGKIGTGVAAASGAYTGVTEGVGAVTGDGTSTEALRTEMGLPANETALYRGARGLGVPENAARLVDDVGSRFAGMANRVAGGVMGMFGNDAQARGQRFSTEGGVRAPERVVPPAAAVNPDAGTPEDLRTVPNVHGEPRTADDLITGTDVPARGTGAFKGGDRQARIVDSRGARGAEATPQLTPGQKAMGGYIGAMAGYNARHREKSSDRADAEVGIKKSQAQTAAAKAALDVNKARSETSAARIKAAVESDPELLKMDKDMAARTSAQRTADMTQRADYSLGRRNAGKGDASPAAINDFLDAEQWRKAVERGRGDTAQSLRDYFGNKQFDSKDSFSYRPAYRKGNQVYTENGNSVDVEVARGGIMRLFGPNDPTNADMQRYLTNLPTKEEFEAKQKAKKGEK